MIIYESGAAGMTQDNGAIRVALIGAGRAGMIHAQNLRNLNAGGLCARLTAVADPAAEACRAACKELEVDTYYTEIEKVWERADIDAVVVVTPTKFHCEIVGAATKSGKHILCEKPMAMNAAECLEMERAAGDAGVKLQIAFMRRFDRAFRKAKAAVDSGAVRDVVMVRSNTRGPSVPQPWMYDLKKSNGPLAEVCSHDIDTVRWFTGSEFESLYAVGGNFRSPAAKVGFPDFYDNVILSAILENGMQGMIDGAQGVRYGYDARVEILGTSGCIFLGETAEDAVRICTMDGKTSQKFTDSWRNLFSDAYLEEDIDFIRCIAEDREPSVTGRDGRMAVRAVEAGNRSIAEKRVVRLDEIG